MIRGWSAVYYREALLLRRRLWKTLATMSVTPLLYLLAFGWAMGQHEGGGLGRGTCVSCCPALRP
jgi:hypothetical protein